MKLMRIYKGKDLLIKRCNVCKDFYMIDKFNPNKYQKDGFYSNCINCTKNRLTNNYKRRLRYVHHDYYVYAWINNRTNEVYYVGKGRGDRAYITKRREGELTKLKEEGHIKIVILEENIYEEEKAYELEAYYTRLYKGLGQCKYNKVIGRSLRE